MPFNILASVCSSLRPGPTRLFPHSLPTSPVFSPYRSASEVSLSNLKPAPGSHRPVRISPYVVWKY